RDWRRWSVALAAPSNWIVLRVAGAPLPAAAPSVLALRRCEQDGTGGKSHNRTVDRDGPRAAPCRTFHHCVLPSPTRLPFGGHHQPRLLRPGDEPEGRARHRDIAGARSALRASASVTHRFITIKLHFTHSARKPLTCGCDRVKSLTDSQVPVYHS